MRQFSAALLEPALGLLGALFRSPRGRHARTAGPLAFRRRSRRVRRYTAPGPASGSGSGRPVRPSSPTPAEPRTREPVTPRETFPADEIPIVRPYFAAHEQAADRLRAMPALVSPAPDEHELDRIQAQALARLSGWTAPRAPKAPVLAPAGAGVPVRVDAVPIASAAWARACAASAVAPGVPRPAPARPSIPAVPPVPRPRPGLPGDLLAPAAPRAAAPRVPRHRRESAPVGRSGPVARSGPGDELEELAAVTRKWLAQQGRRGVPA